MEPWRSTNNNRFLTRNKQPLRWRRGGPSHTTEKDETVAAVAAAPTKTV
jgi:hypothetical protein